MDAGDMGDRLERVLLTEEQIQDRLRELGAQIWADYAGRDLLLVGILKGAVLVMADLMRTLPGSVKMGVSSGPSVPWPCGVPGCIATLVKSTVPSRESTDFTVS